jgi:hypothetical protein
MQLLRARRTLIIVSLVISQLQTAFAHGANLRITKGPSDSGEAFIACIFDGDRRLCFVDTGSAMTLLAGPEALSTNTNRETFHFQGASGIPHEAEIIKIHSATVDGVEFRDVKLGRIEAQDGVKSALGLDLLGRQPFSVSFRRGPSLHLAPLKPRKVLSTLKVGAHRLFCIPVAIGETDTFAMWDTGAGMTVVDEAFITAHPAKFKRTDDFQTATDGAGNSLPVKSYRMKKMKVGGRTFRNLRVVSTDLSVLRGSGNPPVDAVIGFNLIRKCDWYFNSGEKVWSVR